MAVDPLTALPTLSNAPCGLLALPAAGVPLEEQKTSPHNSNVLPAPGISDPTLPSRMSGLVHVLAPKRGFRPTPGAVTGSPTERAEVAATRRAPRVLFGKGYQEVRNSILYRIEVQANPDMRNPRVDAMLARVGTSTQVTAALREDR